MLLCLIVFLCLYPVVCSKHMDEIRDIDVNGVNIVYQVKGKDHGSHVYKSPIWSKCCWGILKRLIIRA